MGPHWKALVAFLFMAVFIYIWSTYVGTEGQTTYPVSYSRFIEQLDAGNIKSVTIKEQRVDGELHREIPVQLPGESKPASVRTFHTFLPPFQGEGLLTTLQQKGVTINVRPEEKGSLLGQLLLWIFPWLLIIGFWVLMMRRTQQLQGGPGGLFGFGASKAKLYDVRKSTVTFKDVAGMEHVKQDLMETVDFLKNPEKYKRLGAKIPKGVLLAGYPGTGKTLLARATAGEAGVPFYSISASEFIEMFVGVGASRVRDMFKKAKETQPSIIFIDEIDAVGRTRGAGLGGGHDEREQTLNQLLSEMDGFEPHEEVIVMAATNRPDVLDPALLRPGRFDRRIVIDRPGLHERKAILEVHTRGKLIADNVDLDNIARGTPGMTGADLENLANEAALIAIRKNKDKIYREDFEEARDVVLMGAVRGEPISDMEKRITAYHESGHALVAWALPNTDPIHKVSIIPRGMAMGVTQLLPEEDRHYYPQSYLMNRLSVALAGMVAERIVFSDTSTGAQSDLKEATSLAEKMVAQWGMSDKVGPVSLGRGEEHPFLGRELAQPKRYSENMAWLMDQEIRRLIVEAEEKAEEVLKNNRHVLENLAVALIKEEVLDKTAIERIINESRIKETDGKGAPLG
ncbi:MAG: ATP-dependent zinc metalloprotease FtsH [Alphaproteobacteria bacterium]|uniref:ATP-dependent zinc metalloprotease FtsH n=1 Tax=Candidatus Nitrobium versatile TaxID=2884831 RepID=A0A953M2L7_9BACT|nr:ATP-dependent zinc metalloprotease FtsH [Candidatus Nitrobium versatile]